MGEMKNEECTQIVGRICEETDCTRNLGVHERL
jgi:hypothetical protein